MSYRSKVIKSGDYLENELYPVSKEETKKTRRRKLKETTKKMKNLNDKNRIKNATRLANTNFTTKDLFITTTYTNERLPKSFKEAIQRLENYIKRIKRRLKKEGLPPLKYIATTEMGKKGRIHHHLIISGDLDRDIIEELWIKREKGFCNTKRLQFGEFGLEGLVKYMLKKAVGYKKVTRSRNLKTPDVGINDFEYSRRKIYDLAKSQGGLELEEKFKGYKIVEFKSVVNEVLDAVYISVKMKRMEWEK